MYRGRRSPGERVNYRTNQERWDHMRRKIGRVGLDEVVLDKIKHGRLPLAGIGYLDDISNPDVVPATGEVLTNRYLTFDQDLLDEANFRFYRQTMPASVLSGKAKKDREVDAPSPAMQRVHKTMIQLLNQHYVPGGMVYGLERDKSYMDCAIQHVGNRYVVSMDIQSAYNKVVATRLSEDIAACEPSKIGPYGWYPFVRRFFMSRRRDVGLATGGNASPLLFNLYMQRFDDVIQTYADAHGLTYTRYMDDIILSSPDTDQPDLDRIGRAKTKFVNRALGAMGLNLHQHKVDYTDLAETGTKRVLGLELRADGSWGVPQEYARNLFNYFGSASGMLAIKPRHELLDELRRMHGLNSYLAEIRRRRGVDDNGQMKFTELDMHLMNSYRKAVRLFAEAGIVARAPDSGSIGLRGEADKLGIL